jgi:hypothetical protein
LPYPESERLVAITRHSCRGFRSSPSRRATTSAGANLRWIALLVCLVAALACLMPACRAIRLDPMIALRAD